MDEMGDNLKVGWFRAPPRTLAMVAAKSLTPWVRLSYRFWSRSSPFWPIRKCRHWHLLASKIPENELQVVSISLFIIFQLILHDLPDISTSKIPPSGPKKTKKPQLTAAPCREFLWRPPTGGQKGITPRLGFFRQQTWQGPRVTEVSEVTGINPNMAIYLWVNN